MTTVTTLVAPVFAPNAKRIRDASRDQALCFAAAETPQRVWRGFDARTFTSTTGIHTGLRPTGSMASARQARHEPSGVLEVIAARLAARAATRGRFNRC